MVELSTKEREDINTVVVAAVKELQRRFKYTIKLHK